MNDSNELLKLKLDLQNIKSIPEHEKNPCSLEYINGHKIANSNLFGPPTDRSASEGSMAESEESIEKDIILMDVPKDNKELAKGMSGGCIAITFYLSNNTLVVGHFISDDSNKENYVLNFFEQLKVKINDVDILEIRIFGPTDNGIIIMEQTSAKGVLKSLEMIKKMNFVYNKIIFIEGKTSQHTFFKNVNNSTTITATDTEEKQASIYYGYKVITNHMNEILKKDQESEYRLRMAKKAIEKAAENRMKEEEQRIIEEEKILRALEIDSYTTLAEQDLEEYRKGLITISDFNEKLIEVINLKNFYILQAYKRVLRNNGSIIKLSKHGLESV